MTRIVFLVIASACVAAAVALARPSAASAGWCWPECTFYGYLGSATSTHTGCWYPSGEVCSYWSNWLVNGIAKKCYPSCDYSLNTTSMVLFGFENRERIRGRLTVKSATMYISPANVDMSGVLRSQVAWYSGPASLLNAAAIG